MLGFKDSIWQIVNLVKGKMPSNEVRNVTLTIYFLQNAIEKNTDVENAVNGILHDMNFSFGHGNPSSYALRVRNVFDIVEDQFLNLKGIFSLLNLDRTLSHHSKEFLILFNQILELDANLEVDYRTGFDELTKLFSEREGKLQEMFYTPSSVKKIYKALLGDVNSIIDPTCGTGSLLNTLIDPKNQMVFGQDYHGESIGLAKLRFAFDPQVQLNYGDSFNSEILFERKALGVVSVPPLNLRYDIRDVLNPYFLKYGETPRSNANLLWVQLVIDHIKTHGRGIVLLTNGSLTSSGAEGNIRKAIIQDGWVEAIISLPRGLFANTSIPASIWVLSKEKQPKDEVLLIDLTDSVEQNGKNNRYIPTHVIQQVQLCHKTWCEGNGLVGLETHQAVSASVADIEANDFVLSPARYLPIKGLENIDFSKAVELSDLLSRQKHDSLSKEHHGEIKKISIKNLSSSTDQYSIQVNELEAIKNDKKDQVFGGDLLLVAKNGDKLKPSFLPPNDSNIGYVLMNIFPFKVDTNLVRLDYLIQELNKNYVQLQLSKLRSGTTISFLREPDFLSVQIILPPLDEQEASVLKEKEIRFQSLAKLHGFESEIEGIRSQQKKDLGAKKHNILTPLNDSSLLLENLLDWIESQNGLVNFNEDFPFDQGTTPLDNLKSIKYSLGRSIVYAENLTNKNDMGTSTIFNIGLEIEQHLKNKPVAENVRIDHPNLEELPLDITNEKGEKVTIEPMVEISAVGLEQVIDNIYENACKHGFNDEQKAYTFRYSIGLEKPKGKDDIYVSLELENNGKPFPKGMGTVERYITQGEKAGETGNTGEGGARVFEIVKHFHGELEVIDAPEEEYPVRIKILLPLILNNEEL